VPCNTICIQVTLNQLKEKSEKVNEEDEARLSPLSHKHANMLVHYSFALVQQVLNGQFKPLKLPPDSRE
jgi:hypothetical protein